MADDKQGTVMIDYTNHAGVRQFRLIIPVKIWFGATPWHEEVQWLVDAHDVGKNAPRTFALASIHRWGLPGVGMTADVSIAKQLQNSMELNARMKNRLGRLDRQLRIDDDVNAIAIDALAAILKDEEPVWPPA